MTFKERFRAGARAVGEALGLVRERPAPRTEPLRPREPVSIALAGTFAVAAGMAKVGDLSGAFGELGQSILEVVDRKRRLEVIRDALDESIRKNSPEPMRRLPQPLIIEVTSISRTSGKKLLTDIKAEVDTRLRFAEEKCKEQKVDEKLGQMKAHLEAAKAGNRYDEVEIIYTYLLTYPQTETFGPERTLLFGRAENLVKKANAIIATMGTTGGVENMALRKLPIALNDLVNAGVFLAQATEQAVDHQDINTINSAANQLEVVVRALTAPNVRSSVERKIGYVRLADVEKFVGVVREISNALGMYVQDPLPDCSEYRQVRTSAVNLNRIFTQAL